MSINTSAPAAADTAPGTTIVEEAGLPADIGHREPEGDSYSRELDALIEAHEKRSGRQAEEKKEEEGLKQGESWDSIYKSVPPDAQRAMAQMRADYTKKTQELARQRKEIEQQQIAMMESPIYSSLKDVAEKDVEYDPFNAETFETLIEKKVAQRLQSLLEPLRVQQQQTQAQSKYENFLADNPDLQSDSEVRAEVKAALEGNPNLSLEDAYYRVKGKRAVVSSRAEEERKATFRRAAKSAALMTTAGARSASQTVREDVRNKSAWEIYESLAKAKG